MKPFSMLLTSALASRNGMLITPIKTPATMIIMYSRSSKPNVFSHRWLTRRRLLERLSNAPVFSIIIVGTTKENMIAKIMPGIMKAISPTMMRMPVIILTTNNESSLVMV